MDTESERLMRQGRHPLQQAQAKTTIVGVPIDNIAENGHWGTLAMVAIALAWGNLRLAFVWALMLFAAYVIEQLPSPRLRQWGAWGVTAWAIVTLIAMIILLP